MYIDILNNKLFLSKVIVINVYNSFWGSLRHMWASKFYHIQTRISGFYILHRCRYEKKCAEAFEILLDFQSCKLENSAKKKKMKALNL